MTKRSYGLWLLVILVVLFVGVGRCGSGSGRDDEWSKPGDKGPHIGVVELKGIITDGLAFEKRMHALRVDKEIDAIVVRIDSPGGAVAPSQEMMEAVRRAKKDKKVVCSMGSLAASGGYYVASACDLIVASPGTLTASIGVISELPKVQGVLALLRVEMDVYKSGALKDVGSPFRASNDEERAFFNHLVQNIYEQFLADVAEGRKGKITMEKLRPIADGRVLTGKEALEAGLVDELGNFEHALDRAVALAGKTGAPVPVFPDDDKGGFFERVVRRAASETSRGLVDGVREEARPRQSVETRDPRF